MMGSAWSGIVTTMSGYVSGFITDTAPITVAIIGLFVFALVLTIVLGVIRSRKG
jgi:hypothetical protein